MRVNYAGEVAAQALYQGQAMTARDPAVRAAMHESANEELDHLAWCAQRLAELGEPVSRLNPLWYAGSLGIGALAGLFGDRVSLGFIAETETQVVTHLEGHLGRLPPADTRSRTILEQMRRDEAGHRDAALAAGGAALPAPVKRAMGLVAKVMTRTAYRL
jgi:ubiquinone biosynthesis monooxygenase Coq7